MKRYIFILAILFCCGWVAAQKPSKKETSSNKEEGSHKALYGIYLGPTIDWFAPTSNALNYKTAKAGLIAGAIVDVNLVPKDILYFTTGVLARYIQGDVSFDNQYNLNNNDTIVTTVRTYQTTYLTIPTGVKFRTNPLNNCIFLGKLGLYHNFKLAGKQFDNFSLSGEDDEYYITTKKKNNEDAALFAESGYVGLGFEYVFQKNLRVFANLDYSCQFNYFNSKAMSNISNARFKTIVHSLHITFGVLF